MDRRHPSRVGLDGGTLAPEKRMRMRRILVPFDNSDPSLDALAYGRVLARGFKANLVAFLALGEEPATGEVGIAEHRQDDADRLLANALASEESEPLTVERIVRWGDPAEQIENLATEIEADLVVMGTHGRKGLARTFLGSVTETVLRASSRPVVTLRGPANEHLRLPKHLLVATDFGAHSTQALAYAVELACVLGAQITIANAFATPLPVLTGETSLLNPEVFDQLVISSGTALADAATSFRGHGVTINTELREGDAPRVVHDLAVELGVDLVVLGTHGRQGLARAVLGSVAEQILRDAPVPVLTVPSRLADTPLFAGGRGTIARA
jgi:nucleotide-binding universal stress UspA family protein